MASFNPDTPLDALELSYISEQLGPYDWRKLGLYLGITETRLANWERQYMMNIEQAASQMLYTWHNNQHPSQERKLLIEALEKTKLRSLGEKVRMGECRRTVPQGMRPIPPEPFNNHQHPTPPAQRYEPIAHLPQQPDILPMRIPQQTSYEITEIKLRDVSNKLGSEWRMVGTFLGFNNSQIEVMHEEHRVIKECIFQMLLQWRNTNGVEATKTKLKKALQRSLREDLVDFIDEADD
ncbi:uncharacterized protein LOC115927213 [Strongylocentrotus purpuratus]|uniref:Death domain-containing protein n=1 Tax=Strongylocentrotus purpuratus TaxID=7668 RepID=A0A7M7PBA9_STRPU|nr:uncharacterized protein LOC115927213 [Strongylocentrotus purpuratus]XP_030848595.1 uncharacterized protein LOC115927213 [Strongylocentrotus purpuratus]